MSKLVAAFFFGNGAYEPGLNVTVPGIPLGMRLQVANAVGHNCYICIFGSLFGSHHLL